MIWIRNMSGQRVATYCDKPMPARQHKPPSPELEQFRREEREIQEQSKLKPNKK